MAFDKKGSTWWKLCLTQTSHNANFTSEGAHTKLARIDYFYQPTHIDHFHQLTRIDQFHQPTHIDHFHQLTRIDQFHQPTHIDQFHQLALFIVATGQIPGTRFLSAAATQQFQSHITSEKNLTPHTSLFKLHIFDLLFPSLFSLLSKTLACLAKLVNFSTRSHLAQSDHFIELLHLGLVVPNQVI